MAKSRNIRLKLAYDGTNFCGWQVQSNGPSIQEALETAIERLTGQRSQVLSAGRTDSGVHALGQVASFRTCFDIPAANFRPALQTKLPPEIVILEACEAPESFHATFAAKSKRYRYVIDNSPISLPFLRRYAWQLRRELDAAAMHAAAQRLVGTHDFRSFETDWPNKATSVRTVFEATVCRRNMWELWNCHPQSAAMAGTAKEPLIFFDIVADGFLYNMVRSIAGTLVNVGRGKWSIDDVTAIVEAQRRSVAGATAPACGLYLVDVRYDEGPPVDP